MISNTTYQFFRKFDPPTLHRLFFYLTLFFLPTQLGYHFWPGWTQVLGRRIDYLSPTLYLTDILVVLTVISWFTSCFLHKFSIFNFKFLKSKLLMIFFILAFVAVNILVSFNKPIAIYSWMKFFQFGGFAYYVSQTKPNIQRVVYFLSFAVFYSSLIAIGQFLLQHSIGGPLWILGERTFFSDTPGIARIALGGREMVRSYATFPHPNVLGGFLAITLPLVIFKQSKKFSMFKIITIIMGIIALLFTFSRSAWIAGLMGLVCIFFPKRKNYFILLTFIVFTTYGLFFSGESVDVRMELNSAAVNIWQHAPLLGVGLGNFLVSLPDFLTSREIYFLQPAHNIYLLLLSEVGFVGASLIIFSMFISRKLFIVHIPLFTLLLLGLVDHYPITLQQGQLLLALLVGLTVSL